ncbi:Txe/YoeB family addiction module toxin [Pectobacterium parmentieri]|uniref:Toxin YoeB n=1 Tax=Pectobacterium parmentieri TaxID=1905730 RepID=A0A8B3FFY4_PECPM|nr:Txe/YoeB family addiction module toxin [Pectobacterium parmentieri]AOR60358.1 toxin YoeB [Pectobacterium parmentieri]AYG99936.1 Txe/YoeB family addiction module toxin [Pectobacterium parmentieri]AYH04419.1 Txe/YoeB family addiction module toxin [Pectobacterium parmentieri]AYH08691.1 Txe/YoeB family addiction module toxin [Pectobacterium parmentieri]AYH13241.1 Txe/YoeB family addiction module toxin [Pectobacterium parmentieri]
MKPIWSEAAWEDYLYWQDIDNRIVKKINELIKEIRRTPFEGKGKPEPLKHNLAGFWSRRITEEHRLVYAITDDAMMIAACRYHY